MGSKHRFRLAFPWLAVPILVLSMLFISPEPAGATLVGGPDIIPAPASIIDDPPGATNDHQQAFDEAQGVLLAADVDCDGGRFNACCAPAVWCRSCKSP